MKTNLPFGNRIYTALLIAVFFFVFNYNAGAQVSTSYSFTANDLDMNYIGGTTLGSSGQTNTEYPSIPIGFSFQYNGNVYTQLGISNNGFIWFGATAPATSVTSPISDNTAEAGVIAAWGSALTGNNSGTAGTSALSYQTTGTAPNRTFTVQWENYYPSTHPPMTSAGSDNRLDLQIILSECSNIITINLDGDGYQWDFGFTVTGQVGLRGSTNSDYFNESVDCSVTDWISPDQGTSNAASCSMDGASGLFGGGCWPGDDEYFNCFCDNAATQYVYTPVTNTCGGNTISTGSISSPICACSTINITFTNTGTFNAGNYYVAQLSNSTGSFAAPVNLDSVLSTALSGTITATIPCNTSNGTGYLIRVISRNPAITGSDNGANITISQPGNVGVVSTLKNPICQNTVAHLTVTGGTGSIQWQSSPDSTTGFTNISGATASTYSSNPISQNTYFRVSSGSGSCAANSVSLKITVIPAPVASFTSTVNGHQVSFNGSGSTGATSYFWDFGDNDTSSLENPVHNYASNTADTFHVCLTVKNNSSCTFTTCLNVYTFPTGVNNISSNNVWQIYPDPFGNQLYIGTGNTTIIVESIEMYDVLGRRIFFKEINGQMNNPMKLDLPNITAGVYFLKIEAKDSDFIKKVIKQ